MREKRGEGEEKGGRGEESALSPQFLRPPLSEILDQSLSMKGQINSLPVASFSIKDPRKY